MVYSCIASVMPSGALEIDFTASRALMCAWQNTSFAFLRASRVFVPGGNSPSKYPMVETMFGSLMVHHLPTPSPSDLATFSEKRANKSAVESFTQPPRAATHRGVVK